MYGGKEEVRATKRTHPSLPQFTLLQRIVQEIKIWGFEDT